MKVKLERKLFSSPDRLDCLACQQPFWAGRVRSLLYSDRQDFLGDLCPICLAQGEASIQQSIRSQISRSQISRSQSDLPAAHRQVLELLMVVDEAVQLPNKFQIFLKHLEVFAQQSKELEAARMNQTQRLERSRLERLLKSTP
jgi:hypothetical protein